MEVKGRLSEPFEEHLKYDNGTYIITNDPREVAAEAKDEEARQAITTILGAPPGARFTVAGISREAAKAGITLGRRQVTRILTQNENDFQEKAGKWSLRPVISVGGSDG